MKGDSEVLRQQDGDCKTSQTKNDDLGADKKHQDQLSSKTQGIVPPKIETVKSNPKKDISKYNWHEILTGTADILAFCKKLI